MEKLKQLWEKIKKWFKETALPWLKKGAIQIINVIVVFYAYGTLYSAAGEGMSLKIGLASGIVGLWAFILAAYWIFWKLFGADKVIKAFIAQKKKERKK